MKKLLFLLLLIPASIAPKGVSPSWPTALSVPFVVAMATGANPETMETLADGLDFNHSRSIECNFDLGLLSKNSEPDDEWEEPNSPLSAKYELRWGYKGAGDASTPFSGIRGRLQIQVSYEGLSFHLCKSKSLRNKIYKTLAPALIVTPCEEFYLKLAQLAWTVSQNNEQQDFTMVREGLETLIARLKLTEGGANCRLYGMPILNSPESPGLELLLSQAPEQFAQRFVAISQKVGAALSMIAGSPRNPEKRAYMRALLSQINYYQETPYRLNLPKGGTITLPFDHVGSGDSTEPFRGTTMTVEIPQTRGAVAQQGPAATTKWEMTLKPQHEFTARLILLVLHKRKNPMPSYKFAEELSTLVARMSITPRENETEPSYLRSLIDMGCQYHQYIMHYDFSQPLDEELDSNELLLQLARVAYRTWTLNEDRTFDKSSTITPQQVADFATKHTADALRCFRGTIALKQQAQERARVPYLEKKGVTLNVGLFVKTLMGPTPGQEDAAETIKVAQIAAAEDNKGMAK